MDLDCQRLQVHRLVIETIPFAVIQRVLQTSSCRRAPGIFACMGTRAFPCALRLPSWWPEHLDKIFQFQCFNTGCVEHLALVFDLCAANTFRHFAESWSRLQPSGPGSGITPQCNCIVLRIARQHQTRVRRSSGFPDAPDVPRTICCICRQGLGIRIAFRSSMIWRAAARPKNDQIEQRIDPRRSPCTDTQPTFAYRIETLHHIVRRRSARCHDLPAIVGRYTTIM